MHSVGKINMVWVGDRVSLGNVVYVPASWCLTAYTEQNRTCYCVIRTNIYFDSQQLSPMCRTPRGTGDKENFRKLIMK